MRPDEPDLPPLSRPLPDGLSRADFLRSASAGLLSLAAVGAAATATAAGAAADATAPEPESQTSPKVLGGDRLKGKKAVITGAARGIGRAVAEAFAREGADVLGIDIAGPVSPVLHYPPATSQDLDETGRLVKAQGRRFIPVVCDVRDFGGLQKAADQAEKTLGPVDILVINAGIQTFVSIADTDERQWRDVIDVNLTGAALTLRAFAPAMVKRKRGRVIFTASGQGRKGTKHGAAYSASKWGMLGLMKSAALDLGEAGITVNAVDPGLTDTALTRNAMRWREAIAESGKVPAQQPSEAEVIEAQKHTSALGVPWVQANDVAPVFVFLASDEAAMVSGAAYDANAGQGAHVTA